MNTPTQQAELYRKAAETIEMCAPHGIEPMVKHCGSISPLNDWRFNGNADFYEFPIAVIEGQLVWKGDELYTGKLGTKFNAYTVKKNSSYDYKLAFFNENGCCVEFVTLTSLTPPKQPLCEVEGKPVYKGDKLWCNGGMKREIEALSLDAEGRLKVTDGGYIPIRWLLWNQPKPTVMVELTIEDAEYWIAETNDYYAEVSRLNKSCRKAMDNLK